MSKPKRSTASTTAGLVGRLVVLLLLLLATGCDLIVEELLNEAIDGSSRLPQTSGADWYEIYFTDPHCPPENERNGGLDEILADDILAAQLQVDIAAFDLDATPIIDALIDRARNGVIVRVVVDNDNSPASTTNRLRRHGISVVEDQRSALMHNKFVIIDGRYVWTGSMNFTTNGAYCNNNNLVRFDAPSLAINYRAEMDEMYKDRSFGARSPINTPSQQLTIHGVAVENYFAPETRVAPILAQAISRAESEILFLAFSFTYEDIGEAMLDQAEAGLDVRGVFETVGASTVFSYYPVMSDAGLPNLQVRLDGNNRIMHHKVIIIDRQTVVFGSFNFTGNANNSNDENVIIVHDPTFAGFFVEEFEMVWDEAADGS